MQGGPLTGLPRCAHPWSPPRPARTRPAGFQLPDSYQAPALGKVRRPGSDVIEDMPTGPADEDGPPEYYDDTEVEA